MNNLLVLVVIPTYNDDPEHIREAVESVKAQTYPHIQLTVVDDGSTRQESISFIDSLAVDVIRQENAGPAAARNVGAHSGNSDLLLFLDADDWIDPTFVAESVRLMADPSVAVTQAVREVFGERTLTFTPPDNGSLATVMGANPYASCGMIRRSRFEEIGGWPEGMEGGAEDTEFWVRVLRDGGTVRVLPSAKFHRRARTASLSHRLGGDLHRLTRQAIIRNNPDHHEVLLWAAFERMDDLAASAREHAEYVKVWQRRVAPLIRLRDAARRILRR